MGKIHYRYHLLFFLVLVGLLLHAQKQSIAFEKFGVEEGLPEEVAFNFVQDKQGYIWIGTQNGLAKFDGYEMEVYRVNLDDPNALHIHNLIGGLLVASDGKIWLSGVGITGGVSCYDPTVEKFTNYEVDISDSTKIPFGTNSILYEDVAGGIWFSSARSNREFYFCKLDPHTNLVSRFPYAMGRKTNDLVLNFNIAESVKDSSIWIKDQNNNLLRYHPSQKAFETVINVGDIIPGTSFRDTIIDINMAPLSGLITLTNNEHLFLWDPIEMKVVETHTFLNRDDIRWGCQFEDYKGNIWVTSHDHISRITIGQQERVDYKFGENQLDFDVAGDVLQIIGLEQDDNHIYFGVTFSDDNGNQEFVLRYNHHSNSFQLFDIQFNDDKNHFVDNGIQRSLKLDNTGLLWVGTRPNLYKESPKTRQIKHYVHDPFDPNSLSTDTIAVLYEDSYNNLWIGSSQSIDIRTEDDKFYRLPVRSKNKRASNLGIVRDITEDSYRNVWVGSDEGIFLCKDLKEGLVKVDFKKSNSQVRSLKSDGKGKMWVSIFNAGVYVLDEKSGKVLMEFEPSEGEIHGLTSSLINEIYFDSKGHVWLGDAFDNEFALFTSDLENIKFVHHSARRGDSTSLNNNEISFIGEDDQNRIWVGTDGGVNLYDRDKDVFLRNTDNIKVPSTTAYIPAGNGKIWTITYSGGGLILIGPEIEDFEMFGEDVGLLHNDANNMVFDDYGQIWLPTVRGLSVFDTLTKSYSSFYKKDGYEVQGRRNRILKDYKGDIWIGGFNGLNRIIPEEIAIKDKEDPIVHITSMTILDTTYSSPDGVLFSKAVSYTEEVSLAHWQKDFKFEFVGLHYLRPEENLYSWKLEPYDKQWSLPSKNRSASYTNLSPGTYTFKVKASNSDGFWNEDGDSIVITINSPWWQTFWAYGAYTLLLLLLGKKLYDYQKNRTLEKERKKSQEKELQQAKEIKKAYSELKSTQEQLIQSEKMASLGELTAGIAHEIQNPLNFVNNFSDVSRELIDEMKNEMESGDHEEALSIAEDIKNNLSKINHHGRRADGIVKGMLLHSRESSGERVEADINNLVDEYLRLSYHGLRAKDTNFKASFETSYDEDLPKVSLIAQDVGRVFLNTINNAFQAVHEKSLYSKNGYVPKITVSTQKVGEKIVVDIEDNGPGISKENIDKIFQPFFTTKPTGQGTGLGLSLSYDIIKAHGGEINVDSNEQGTTFSITLPHQENP